MAYTPIYTPKNYTDWGPPDLDASNLNDIEAALVSLGNGLQTAAADTDTNTAAITTINGEISDLNNLIDSILPDDSASGNPAVITDAFGGECKSLKLTLDPVQDLNGYAAPWAGGCKKNMLPYSRSASQVINDVTFTVNADGTINVNGTASQTATFLIQWGASIAPMVGKSVILNGCPAVSGIRLQWCNSDGQGGAAIDTGAGTAAFTPATVTNANIAILVSSGATITNQVVMPMVRLSSVVDATYEPYDNICPISGRTQSTTTKCGKNVCPYIESGGIDRTTGLDYPDAGLTRSGFIPIKRNKTYTIAINVSRIAIRIFKYDANKKYIDSDSTIDVQASTAQFNFDCDYIRFQAGASIIPTSATVQIEIGTTATEYEAYNAENITRAYGQTVYKGIDETTGTGATSKYGFVEFDGSADESWQTGLAPNCFSIARGGVPADLPPAKYITNSFEPSDSAALGKMFIGTNYINVCYAEIISTVADWKTYLSTHPLQICYELAAPVSIPLTSQNFTLLKGDNTITTDADNVEVDYKADIALYIAEQIGG